MALTMVALWQAISLNAQIIRHPFMPLQEQHSYHCCTATTAAPLPCYRCTLALPLLSVPHRGLALQSALTWCWCWQTSCSVPGRHLKAPMLSLVKPWEYTARPTRSVLWTAQLPR